MNKNIVILGVFTLLTWSVAAQESNVVSYPVWTISKGVQQLSFRNVTVLPARVTTTNQLVGTTKGVNMLSQQAEVKGQVQFTGTPSWIISKGVARLQYERASK